MTNKRAQFILLVIITTLSISVLLFVELVTVTNAVDQVGQPNIGQETNAAKSFTIDVGINPVGSGQIRIDPPGLSYGDGDSVSFSENVSLTPDFDSDYWQFTNWSGTYVTTTSPLLLPATQDYNVTANFSRRCFNLTLEHTGGGNEGVNPTTSPASSFCDPGQYAADENINLLASGIDGWRIAGWSGTLLDSSKAYTNSALMPLENHTIIVHYEPVCYELTTHIDPSDTGSVARIPEPDCPVEIPGNRYHKDTAVSLSATAENGYEFLNWTGDTEGSTSNSTMLVTMNKDRAITAHFDLACHILTLAHTPSNSESGSDPTATPDKSPKCAAPGEYVAGHNINLFASPNSGWQVESWLNTDNDASISSTNTLEFPALPSNSEGYIVTANYIQRPTLQFKDNGYRVIESIGEVTIFVKRTGSLAETARVTYATSNGSAKSGQDYVATSGTLTFGPDVSEKSFTVTIKNDNIKEGDENFFLKLSNPVDALLGSLDEIELTITDDEGDPTVNFSSIEYESLEFSSPATISITLFPASASDVFVVFDTTEGGSATNGLDYYWDELETLHFRPGDTSKQIYIPLEDDTLDEPDETVLLELPNIYFAERGESAALLTIIDDDAPPNVYFDETNYYANEGDPTAPVTITLSAASGLSVTVDYEVIELTVGRQFADTITFEPGEESKKIEIPIGGYVADDQLEIVLDKAVNATLVTPSSATLTIFDKNRSECHQLTMQNNGSGSLPVTTNIDHSDGCSLGYFVADTLIDVLVDPDPGWTINGWHGTVNDNAKSSENVVKMPDSAHTVTVYYLTHAYLPTIMQEYATYFEGPQEIEPNNTLSISQANGPLKSGHEYLGSFPSTSDQFDVFYLFLADRGNIQVELTDIPAGRDYNLYLYSAEAVLKGYSGALNNNDEHISSSNLEEGIYYIAINFAEGTPSSAKYTVKAVYD